MSDDRSRPGPSIEDLASEVNLKYWDTTYEDAQYLQRQYEIPIPQGMLMSLILDLIAATERLHEEE